MGDRTRPALAQLQPLQRQGTDCVPIVAEPEESCLADEIAVAVL
jgi:hypothetical protein